MPDSSHRPLFIAFEGIDGAGKTTQAHRLLYRMNEKGHPCIAVREPGETRLGEQVRTIIKNIEYESHRAEMMLFCAARAELVATIIQPALDAGRHVVADRFAASTVAYQGFARGLDIETIQQVNAYATDNLEPDLTIYLEIPPALREQRQLERAQALDRMELLPDEFYARVIEGYRHQRSLARPGTWATIDATPPVDAVADAIWTCVQQFLGPHRPPNSYDEADGS